MFRCRVLEGQPEPTDEAQEVRWLTPAESAELMNEAHAIRVHDALQHREPKVRAHDGIRVLTS